MLRKHCDRRYRRKRVDLRELEDAQPVRSALDVESTAIEAERVRWLRGVVDALPEAQRLVVALHYLAEQSLEQIGELLAIEPNAAKQRLHTARKRLQQMDTEPRRANVMETIMRSARASSDTAFSDTVQLFLAIRSDDVELVRALLERNSALVDARECWSVHELQDCALPFPTKASPLIRAAELGRLAIVELLFERGADIDGACGCVTRESPLWAAAASNRVEVAELLLRHGADPDRAGTSGIRPLHIAAMRGSQALLDLLLAHGASREQADPSGRTAADWAQSKGHAALAARLGELEVTIAIEPCMQRVPMERVWQSGIKALDLFAPIAPGALVRVEGGPGAGRNNVLLAELAHNATSDSDTAVLWVSCVACAAEHHDVHRRPVAGRRDAVLAPPFDTLVAFDPVLAKAMHFPALDPLGSCSRPLPGVAGYDVADAARSLLRQDQHRAQCLRAYLTQPFFVAEPFSGRPGLRVARADMLADVATLLGGAAEALHPKQLLYRGRLPAAG